MAACRRVTTSLPPWKRRKPCGNARMCCTRSCCGPSTAPRRSQGLSDRSSIAMAHSITAPIRCAHVSPQALHPVLGMPRMAPAGVLALPGPLGGVREGGGAVGAAFLRQRVAEKRRAEDTPTFAEAARRVVEQKRAGWRNSRHPQSCLASLERYAFPRIGNRLICEVTSADVLEILTPIWHDKAQTARRLRQRVRSVLEWAVAMELRVDNPCDRIGPVLGSQQATVEHMRALPQESARVPHPERRAAARKGASEATSGPADRGRAARFPFHLPGLGSRGDKPPAGGDRGGAGARGTQPGRGRIRAIGPVRAAAAADGRMGQRPPPNRIARQHAR